MQIFSGIMSVVISAFLIWILYRYYKSNPEAFSLQNINKSLLTMGLLALVLIALIGFAVVLLRG